MEDLLKIEKRKAPPTIKKIVEFWEKEKCETDIGVDWADAHERCWRCSRKTSNLERCHIIPHSLGGSNKPNNFVILCLRCHKEAPNVNDKRFMWDWITATSMSNYESFFTTRCHLLFFDIYGRMPFSGSGFKDYGFLELLELSEMYIDKFSGVKELGLHFGDNANESSMVASYARAEEGLIGVAPKPIKRVFERRFLEKAKKSLGKAKTPTRSELLDFLKKHEGE